MPFHFMMLFEMQMILMFWGIPHNSQRLGKTFHREGLLWSIYLYSFTRVGWQQPELYEIARVAVWVLGEIVGCEWIL